jgi:hypothetical protein
VRCWRRLFLGVAISAAALGCQDRYATVSVQNSSAGIVAVQLNSEGFAGPWYRVAPSRAVVVSNHRVYQGDLATLVVYGPDCQELGRHTERAGQQTLVVDAAGVVRVVNGNQADAPEVDPTAFQSCSDAVGR